MYHTNEVDSAAEFIEYLMTQIRSLEHHVDELSNVVRDQDAEIRELETVVRFYADQDDDGQLAWEYFNGSDSY